MLRRQASTATNAGSLLPFSLENCFLMEQERLLLRLADGETSHEVDSIIECRGPKVAEGRE